MIENLSQSLNHNNQFEKKRDIILKLPPLNNSKSLNCSKSTFNSELNNNEKDNIMSNSRINQF
jgi:hypothetical protein